MSASAAKNGLAKELQRLAAATVVTLVCMPQPAQAAQMKLPEIVKSTIGLHFQKNSSMTVDRFISELEVSQAFQKPAGVFVTLSTRGQTRACWGSIYPQYDTIAKATVYATLGALTKEYRFKPITQAELSRLKAQVTVVKDVEPVANLSSINPFRDGIMVRSGGKSGVILPGEASCAHYELVMAKLKAGIKPGEPFQMYKIRAEIYD